MRKNLKAGLIILTALVMILTVAALFDEQAQVKQVSEAPELPAANASVYMAGCQAYPKRIPPIVVYKTVRKNFVTMPCALEVPPPGGVLDWQKVMQYHSIHGPAR